MEQDAVDRVLAQWHRERPDLDVSAMGVLGRIARVNWLARTNLQAFFAQFGLEIWEFDVLATLRRSAAETPVTSGRLAEMTMVGSAATTNRVEQLVRRGLVRRQTNPNNRRQLLISLTPKGRELVDEVVGQHVANQQETLSGLTSDEMETLTSLLRKLLISQGDTP